MNTIRTSCRSCWYCYNEQCNYKGVCYGSAQEIISELREEIKQVRQETAKEIFDKLRNRFIEMTAYGCDSNQHVGYYDYTIKVGDCVEEINEIARHYGIEV